MTASFLPDSNVLVAALLGSHPEHGPASAALEDRLSRWSKMVVSAHAVFETFSVMTRLPPGLRLPPDIAALLIEERVLQRAEVVQLSAADSLQLFRSLAPRGISGGRVFDAIVAACAQTAGVDELLTFNVGDFAALSTIPVVRPA